MYSQLLGGLLAVLGAASAAPTTADCDPNYPRSVTQQFHLRGNNTGIPSVDGVLVGTRLTQNTYIGFGLPYGQQPRLFGYDPSSAYVYAGSNAKGQPLILGAYPMPNNTAAIRPGVKGEAGQTPIECTVLAKVLFCNVNVGNTLYHDIVAVDYKNDGHYELAMAPSSADGTAASLVVES